MGGAPRGHAAPPRLRAVARERAGRRPPGRHRRPAAPGRRPGRGAHVRARAVRAGAAGYATEAGAAALDYGFEEAGLERVVGIAKPENAASVRRARKLGMRAARRGRVLGQAWAKYEVAAAAWRAEQAAALPPLVTERLELRRFAAADLEPLLAVFGDADVMRYVGAERRPLAATRSRPC